MHVRLFDEAIEELSDIGSRGEVLEVQSGLAEYLLLKGDATGALSLADETISQAHALGGVAPQIPGLLSGARCGLGPFRRQRWCPRIAASEPAGAEEREVEYEVALTMRVLAAVETDPREKEVLAGAAAQTFAKLKVDWTPDLMSGAATGRSDMASQSEQ